MFMIIPLSYCCHFTGNNSYMEPDNERKVMCSQQHKTKVALDQREIYRGHLKLVENHCSDLERLTGSKPYLY